MTIAPMGEPLEDVRYEVEIKGGPNPGWRVRRVSLAEAFSEPYDLALDLVTEQRDVTIDPSDLLGADVVLDLERNGFARTIQGIVDRVSSASVVSNHFTVTLRVVPAWSYLAQHVDTRIFQDSTTPEILHAVLEPALRRYGRALDVSRLHEQYVVRDYCVQYAESIFDFASRLMEEEGICYYFRPEEANGKPTGVELMVLADQEPSGPNADFDSIDGIIDKEVRIIADRPGTADVESIQSLEWIRPEQANKVVMRRFNWKRPAIDQPPEAEKSGSAQRERIREIYIPDDSRRVEDKAGDDAYEGTEVDEDEQQAIRRRFELLASSQQRGSGTSNLLGMRVGGIFTLADHGDDAIAGERLLVTRVALMGVPADAQPDADAGAVPFYNSFTCILADTPFRPPLKTPRPRIFGPQTAIVTGPAGEEIHTDKHGRIKVRFHWDRLSPHDDTSSCWVRVAQTWAGPSWGTWFVPRVGMEVLVEFLDGNPDRPVVTGCVYNGANGTPYALPGDKTKSTIKTNSSPGGGGSNELRFEDAKGSEEIYTHAQKDYNEVVENNHSTTVHANQTNSVDGSQTQSVGGSQSETVSGEQTMTVKKNRTVTIDGSQSVTIKGAQANSGVSGSKLDITGDYKVDASNTIEVRAPTHIKLTVGGSSILIEPGKITIEAGGLAKVVFDANAEMTSSAGSKVKLDGDVLTVASHGAQVKLTTDVHVLAAGGGELKLTGDADLYGAKTTISGMSAGLELTADATLSGANVSVSGDARVGLAAPAVSSAASGSNEITGAVVKIN